MVTTKHCCYGVCRSDSRYGHRETMKGVTFMPFPKPHIDRAKSERWIRACKRDRFGIDNITKHTYICSLHFIGGNGPTDKYPDPVDATASPAQIQKSARKQKRPTLRSPSIMPLKRRNLLDTDTDTADVANILVELSWNTTESCTTSSGCSASVSPDPALIPCPDKLPLPVPVTTCDQQTQTPKNLDPSLLAVKIENVTLKQEIANLRQQLDECQHDNERVVLVPVML